jgi:Arc/MetJ-type ribon-helix-helix transcriptional regulator
MIAAQEFSIENEKKKREKMVLISVHIPKLLLDIIDDLVRQGVYPSRSEAIRDAIRLLLQHFRDHEAQPQ